MIVVIPDGDTRYGCGQWVDSPVTGNFEQYVVHDVVAHVDSATGRSPTPTAAEYSASLRVASVLGTSGRATLTLSELLRCSPVTLTSM